MGKVRNGRMDPGINETTGGILAGIGTLFATVTGWIKYKFIRIDARIDRIEDANNKNMKSLHQEIRSGFEGVHHRLDNHIDKRP